ncbi:hypothetical protein THASP1DRAFT_27203 [Thamnocephalis sphaerospora]|uniref:RanBD1 domain-containing protein n=1 Tax=Thamnocephalis sphaerospora TaxID=78915 RepID=A0A4P9XZW5_9FUNG|nr:hypothetical protein THASP1DRAFT_27203 [Thamnocephalis sphaerospora]|eukprot:RKP11030.1 hypothetical protein THASP1DRAFT_27203 [Thamnocephalis sphaerospora]
MSSASSPDASDIAAQKKRDRDVQTDVTFEDDTAAHQNTGLARPESPRKKKREEDDSDAEQQPSISSVAVASAEDLTKAGHGEGNGKTAGQQPASLQEASTGHAESKSAAVAQKPAALGGFRFGSSALPSFDSIAASSGASPFAALAAASRGVSALDAAANTHPKSAGVSTTVVMASTGDDGEEDEKEQKDEECDEENERKRKESSLHKETGTATEESASVLTRVRDENSEFARVEVHTGEEEEETIFEMRAKLYELEKEAWRERGVGLLHLNVDQHGENARVVMRRERTMQLMLNSKLIAGMDVIQRESSLVFPAASLGGERRSFLVKLKTAVAAKELSEKMKKHT